MFVQVDVAIIWSYINVQVPTSLTNEQRSLFEKLGSTLGTEVKPQERSFFDRVREVLGG